MDEYLMNMSEEARELWKKSEKLVRLTEER